MKRLNCNVVKWLVMEVQYNGLDRISHICLVLITALCYCTSISTFDSDYNLSNLSHDLPTVTVEDYVYE